MLFKSKVNKVFPSAAGGGIGLRFQDAWGCTYGDCVVWREMSGMYAEMYVAVIRVCDCSGWLLPSGVMNSNGEDCR